MAQGNGQDETAALRGRLVSPGHTIFKIGGKDVSVPPLTLWALEARDPEMSKLGKAMSVREYANLVLLIAATSVECDKSGEDADPKPEAIEATFNRYKRRISFGEMRMLVKEMDELLLNSGYEANPEGEVQAATVNPGTGTLTDSPPTSQTEESVGATQSE